MQVYILACKLLLFPTKYIKSIQKRRTSVQPLLIYYSKYKIFLIKHGIIFKAALTIFALRSTAFIL